MFVVILRCGDERRGVEMAVVVLDEICNWSRHTVANRTLTMMKKIGLLLLLCAMPLLAQNAIEKDIRVLAADDMEGRGLGTKGIDRAATYLESRMREIGLTPIFGKSYRQP